MTGSDAPDVIVVGAGAAGLMVGIAAAQKGARVRLLDSQTKIGAKILVSGGGRCNVTNEYVHPSRFHSAPDTGSEAAGGSRSSNSHSSRSRSSGERSFVGRVLRAFSVEDTHRFFEALGVSLKLEETGKYFPISDSSRTVLDALLGAVRDSGVELVTGCAATGVCASNARSANARPDNALSDGNGAWTINTPQGAMTARSVVLCTGGLALPKSGSNGAGYAFATRLGHTLVATTPALSPLLANAPAHAALSGVTLPARLSLWRGELLLARYDGSFLWTHIGYSGPVALNISRHIAREFLNSNSNGNGENGEHRDGPVHGSIQSCGARVTLRLLPAVPDGEEGRWWHEFVRDNARKTALNALCETLPRRVAEMIAASCRLPPQTVVGKLSAAQAESVRRALFDLPLPVHAVAPYVKAEATAGGIALPEIEPATMMSRRRAGLFFAGEICDVDGWLGGYNFQWAWSSGVVAGRAAARYARLKNEGGE